MHTSPPISTDRPGQTTLPARPGRIRRLDDDPPPSGETGTARAASAPTTASPKTDAERRAALDAIVERIRDLDRHIGDKETKAVEGTIRKGQHLSELKTLAAGGKGIWSQTLKRLHLHPRVASRHIAIWEWAHRIGLLESDLAKKLPFDALKLEALTKLDLAGLRRLAKDHDLRERPRPAVKEAVNVLLGGSRSSQTPRDDAERRRRTLDNLIRRLVDLLAKADDGTKERLAGTLATALDGLKTVAPSRSSEG